MTLQPISSKTQIYLSPSPKSPFYSIFISQFCTSSAPPYPHQPQSHRFHSSRRHHHLEEELRNVKVSVWWDFENCNLPAGANVYKVAHGITAAVRANGIKGPVQITAFGDVLQLSRANQEALSSTGINLAHVPRGGKNSADRSLLVDLMYWVSQNPPPAHLFLISGDRDFASVLHRLRMSNYNVLLASKDTAHGVLCSAASIMWRWNSLVRGENLTGKVFNQPPDGPYGSWYGHYKVPLEDPFAEQSSSVQLQGDELTDACSEIKLRPIPDAVMKQISNMLRLYPNGIPVTQLRTELAKSNVGIDKDFYGYKKFSRFLLSMPDILKLHATSDGQHLVHGIIPKAKAFEPSRDTEISDGNRCSTKFVKPKVEGVPVTASVDQKSLIHSSPELSTEAPTKKLQVSPPIEKAVKMDVQPPPKEMAEPHSIGQNNVEVINLQVARETRPPTRPPTEEESKVGFLKNIWRWFGGVNDSSKGYDTQDTYHINQNESGKKNKCTVGKLGGSNDCLEKKEVGKFAKAPNQENDAIVAASSPSSNSESTLVKETTKGSEPYSTITEKSPSFINLIKKIIWGNDVNSNSLAEQPSGKPRHVNSYSGVHEMFSDDSFWGEMESFLGSQGGSLLVSKSRTREQMARNLQKEGPTALRSLNKRDLLQLVGMLITEKKWVEENISEASPFKLIQAFGKDTSLGISSASNGLRSIFMSIQSQSASTKPSKHRGDGRTGSVSNISHAGVSQPASSKKSPEKSIVETKAHCQKLVNEIIKEFPQGYNCGSFKKQFLEKYGYHLDVQKLGYRNLGSLLQTIPGVKIESTHIIPSSDVRSVQDCNVSCSSAALGGDLSDYPKDDESDSSWDELGPVDNSGSRSKELEETCSRPRYEPPLSDDDMSDSEGEASALSRSEGQAKCQEKSEDSSLLQILDQWYSSKDGINSKGKSENAEYLVNCSENGLRPSDSYGMGIKSGSSGNYGSKPKAQKSYSFVAVSDGNDENNSDKLFDGIVSSLRKSGKGKCAS
ncbi:uncharacterized protein LOC126656609 [Mercurialis annua]|uniref:uncharacterized protein LOC126656609 n=1 Tax=Mercurialis annua TaxID=3986 RepID=UPI00215E15AC|nr:uncharacterized protein LOC126656609 [Mercurialis annua]